MADLGAALVQPYVDIALGLDRLGAGQPVESAARLRRVNARLAGTGLREATVLQYHADLVLSQLESGDKESARRVVRELDDLVSSSPIAWSRAALLVCRALVADAVDAHAACEDAIALYGRIPDPFAQARAQLVYGSLLRRAKRRRAARDQLAASLATFEELRAKPWRDRASQELRAAGVNVARQPAYTAGLAPQETQIALSVAEGRTNREVASALFLSVKTVEYHLGRVYVKLGVRSRVELARLLTS
ncbi:helix-turn-helix transcriptional regulator [Kutzneria buriramensis]|uniref:helix-turn-helix transcriptional regulator n=1 Tax=Kutzneria buriramensis TaxID=1045776 RepID=UPI0014775B74|nr:helix-turn-helix transcriptional regulator [Kutzneria buriramensis]